MRHQYEYRFNGCRHILLEEYDIIREEIQPRKSNYSPTFSFERITFVKEEALRGRVRVCRSRIYLWKEGAVRRRRQEEQFFSC